MVLILQRPFDYRTDSQPLTPVTALPMHLLGKRPRKNLPLARSRLHQAGPQASYAYDLQRGICRNARVMELTRARFWSGNDLRQTLDALVLLGMLSEPRAQAMLQRVLP
ncbi:MAG TPA: hypothetical protein VGA65_03805 [Hyphomicrobium sp.]